MLINSLGILWEHLESIPGAGQTSLHFICMEKRLIAMGRNSFTMLQGKPDHRLMMTCGMKV